MEATNYVRLTDDESIDHEGLNTYDESIYIYPYDMFPEWVYINGKCMTYLWTVTIPDDANVITEKIRTKTDKCILSNKRNIWDTKELYTFAVTTNGLLIYYVKEQTDTLCKLALQENDLALGFIHNQTDELYKIVLKKNGDNIQYIENPSDELCTIATITTPEAIKYIKDLSPDLLMNIVTNNPAILQHINKQTQEICNEAVRLDKRVYKYVNISFRPECKQIMKQMQKDNAALNES